MKKGTKAILKRWLRRALKISLALGFLGFGIILYANLTAIWASRGRLFDNVSDLPQTQVGLVFGTSDKMPNGRDDNLYFRYRIDAAVEVWKAGKVETLIVSGDNLSDPPYYNEPDKMRRALVKRGVPEDRIVSDPRGMRTLDSVVRAKEVFGTDTVLLISQRFHNERAIYLAKANGIQAYGFNARDVDTQTGLKTRIREVGARVKMWLDVNFLNTRPSHMGKKIELPE
jgi:SanA protein